MDKSIKSLVNKLAKAENVNPTPFDDRTYTPRALLLCSLPYSNPKTRSWSRRAGNYVLTIRADDDFDIPYGSYPRLFNYWLTNEVKRTGQRTVKTGSSYERFLYALGVKDGGYQRKNFSIQAHNFLTAEIKFTEYAKDIEKPVDWMRTGVAKRYSLIWDTKNPKEESLFETEITLTEDYFNEIMQHAIPLNTKIIHALKRSAIALDLYGWINYRTFVLNAKRIPHITIFWNVLNQQFGSQYARHRDFANAVRWQLQAIKALWPELKILTSNKGLTIYPSPPSVAPKKLYLKP